MGEAEAEVGLGLFPLLERPLEDIDGFLIIAAPDREKPRVVMSGRLVRAASRRAGYAPIGSSRPRS